MFILENTVLTDKIKKSGKKIAKRVSQCFSGFAIFHFSGFFEKIFAVTKNHDKLKLS